MGNYTAGGLHLHPTSCWGAMNEKNLIVNISQLSYITIHFHRACLNTYMVALRSIPIHYCGECQEDIRVCPRTAHFQRTGGIVHQHIQCLLIHYHLKKQWVSKKKQDMASLKVQCLLAHESMSSIISTSGPKGCVLPLADWADDAPAGRVWWLDVLDSVAQDNWRVSTNCTRPAMENK